MVTLLGFLFIIVNMILLEIFIPDLIGPVWTALAFVACHFFDLYTMLRLFCWNAGSVMGVLQLCFRVVDVRLPKNRRETTMFTEALIST